MGKIIAVAGKGGTGKTTISSLIVKNLLLNKKGKILAIDADPNANLAEVLGLEADESIVGLIEEITKNPDIIPKGTSKNQYIDQCIQEMIAESDGFDLLVMGRPEGPGCFCSINDLLRYGIEALSADYDITIIDGEAGPEQINRRVMRNIDYLAIMTDTSARGIRTAGVVGAVAAKGGTADLKRSGLVINRIKDDRRQAVDAARNLGQDIFGIIPEDPHITKYDLAGTPILELPEAAGSVAAVRDIVANMGI